MAGEDWRNEMVAGEAVRIMAGAPVPEKRRFGLEITFHFLEFGTAIRSSEPHAETYYISYYSELFGEVRTDSFLNLFLDYSRFR